MTQQQFECEIQARFRDLNIGGHVDNVEAVRIIDEARLLFCLFAPLHGEGEQPGLFRHRPAGITDLMGAQRIDYRTEMRFAAFQPFLARMWVARIGRTSFTLATELRVAPDREPAVVAESTLVCWETATEAAWPISSAMRADLERYLGPPVGLRGN